MKNLLVKIYHGELDLMGNVFKETLQQKTKLRAVEEAAALLKSTFSDQQNQLYDELNAAQSEVSTVIEDAAFTEGFKLAMQLMTTAYYENDDSLIKKWSSFFMEEKQDATNT